MYSAATRSTESRSANSSRLMRRLARAANGYVIMSAHPSLQGIASKSGLSGSTQWHNSVRARAYLRGPNDKENGERGRHDVSDVACSNS